MYRSSGQCLLVLLLPLVIPPLAGCFGPEGAGDLIDGTCGQTLYYGLCAKSLRSDPRSASADLKGLAVIMLNVTTAEAADTLSYIKALVKRKVDPAEAKPLEYCAGLYSPMARLTLPLAAKALIQGRYRFADYRLAEAAMQPPTCEGRFGGAVESPLTDRNVLAHDLCAVSMDIVNQLMKG
ncbi:putative invertase inhibitor [Eucalyptus grandis]|nr:putative invertase inhibitor [Eucalyptus grandis]